MRFERITAADHPEYDRAFQLYEISFPIHERRTREKQSAVLSHPEYRYEVIWEGGTFVGIVLSWRAEDFCYVEHFAIAPELRGRNFGSRALELLKRREGTVILEIDPLVDEAAVRRKRFYEKLGFCANPWDHIHPPYRPDFQGHGLVVMTCPRAWTRKEYQAFAHYLGATVMEDCEELRD